MPVYDAFVSYSHAKDKPIAAALQSVIQKLGKAWYQRRAARVFRDDTSLSATPHLWPSIENALSESSHLILLASVEAANSPWIAKEVEYWLEHKSPDTLLIGLTAGELSWDDKTADFKWSSKTPLPKALKGRFTSEPKWVELGAYRDGADPRNAKFIDRGADFAAAIRGVPKDDLMSEEVRQQRRARRLAVGAATSLLVLAGAALWQWGEAATQRATAIQQRDEALIAQSRLIAKASQDALGTGSASKATLLALEALPGRGPGEERPYVVDAERALRASLAAPQEIFRISAKLGSDEPGALKNAVAIGDSDIFIAEERDILHYQIPRNAITRSPLEDQPIAIHLSRSNRLFIGTKSRRVLASGLDAKAPAVLAELPYDIANISSSPDGASLLVAGEETWSLLDATTGKVIKLSAGGRPRIIQSGNVVYDREDTNPREIRMVDPSSKKDTVLFRTAGDTEIIDFAVGKAGDALVILTTEQILALDLSSGKKTNVALSILSTQWQSMVVADSGRAALICAFRSPICVLYDFDSDDALPLYHSENADPVAFGASASEFMTFTSDGRLYTWNANSRGSHDYVLPQPEFKLELLGGDVVRARLLADLDSFVTVAWRQQDVVVQGWKKRITRLHTAALDAFSSYILRGQAEDGNLWLLPGDSSESYLYDFDRDELIPVPFDDSTQRVRRVCGSPRLMLVVTQAGLELWDASGTTVRKIAIPDQLSPLLSDRERLADLICNQKTLAIAAGDKVFLWQVDGEAIASRTFAGEVKEIRALEADGELLALETDNLVVLNTRGEELASAKRELITRKGVTLKLGAVCAVADKGALLMVPAEEEHGTSMVYRFEIVGNKINFLAEHELEASKLYRHAFNRACTLLAYHGDKSREAGVFDLEKGKPIAEFGLGESEYWGIDFAEKSKGLFLFGGSGQIYLVNFDADLGRSTDYARDSVISCLTLEERAAFSLATEPPPWCITGAGRETESDPSHWVPKPPYDSDAWRDWLNAVHVARDKGDTPPPVPNLID